MLALDVSLKKLNFCYVFKTINGGDVERTFEQGS